MLVAWPTKSTNQHGMKQNLRSSKNMQYFIVGWFWLWVLDFLSIRKRKHILLYVFVLILWFALHLCFFLLYSTNGKFFATCMRTTTQIHLFIYLIFFPFFVLFFNFMFYRCWNINTMLCVYIQIKWKSHSDSTFMWRYEVCCFFIQNTNKKRHQTHIG